MNGDFHLALILMLFYKLSYYELLILLIVVYDLLKNILKFLSKYLCFIQSTYKKKKRKYPNIQIKSKQQKNKIQKNPTT